MTQILMTRGDTKEIDVAVIVEGEPQNITGHILRFTAKFSPLDAQAFITKDNVTPSGGITVTNPLAGEATISLLPADTVGLTIANPTTRGVYYTPTLVWDIQLETPDGGIYTLDSGRMIVRADITTPVA